MSISCSLMIMLKNNMRVYMRLTNFIFLGAPVESSKKLRESWTQARWDQWEWVGLAEKLFFHFPARFYLSNCLLLATDTTHWNIVSKHSKYGYMSILLRATPRFTGPIFAEHKTGFFLEKSKHARYAIW